MSRLFKFITLLSLVLISILSLCVSLPASAATKKVVVKKKVVEYRYLESINKCLIPADRSYKTIKNYEKFTDLKACKDREIEKNKLEEQKLQENEIKQEQKKSDALPSQKNLPTPQDTSKNNSNIEIKPAQESLKPETKEEIILPKTTRTGSYYANCTEARAAGVTPIYRGQPGYASKLDRDNDGIACE